MENVLEYLEGSFGALVMAGFGMLFILSVMFIFPLVALFRDWRFGVLCLLLPGPATLAFIYFYYKHKEVKLLTVLTFASLAISLSMFLLRAFLSTFFIQTDLS